MSLEKRRFPVCLQLALIFYVVLIPIGYATLWAGGSKAYPPVNQFLSHMWGSIFVLPLVFWLVRAYENLPKDYYLNKQLMFVLDVLVCAWAVLPAAPISDYSQPHLVLIGGLKFIGLSLYYMRLFLLMSYRGSGS